MSSAWLATPLLLHSAQYFTF